MEGGSGWELHAGLAAELQLGWAGVAAQASEAEAAAELHWMPEEVGGYLFAAALTGVLLADQAEPAV